MENPSNADDVEISMQNKLRSLPSYSNSKCCIYKVPEFVRHRKKECYRPKVISIGPVYYKDPTLEAMQELKWIFLDTFLKNNNNGGRSLNPYINRVREMKDEIRDSYQDEDMLSSCVDDDDFIQMITLDAVFLICYFSMSHQHPSWRISLDCSPNNPIPKKLIELMYFMQTDILILENQLPFLVLKGIFNLACPGEPTSLLLDAVREFIRKLHIAGGRHVAKGTDTFDASEIAHLLDFYRKCCCPSVGNTQHLGKFIKYPGKAKALSAAGIKFRKSESLNLLCVTFNSDNGELSIPSIVLDNKSEAFLRNLLHFEQCHYPVCEDHAYFGDLFFFLDSLIDSVEDIQILQQNGILKNGLGSDQRAADFFNDVPTYLYIFANDHYYWDVSERVTEYANKSWNRWMAILRKDYFGHPWAIISFVYAILIFLLTVTQAVTGIIKK